MRIIRNYVNEIFGRIVDSMFGGVISNHTAKAIKRDKEIQRELNAMQNDIENHVISLRNRLRKLNVPEAEINRIINKLDV